MSATFLANSDATAKHYREYIAGKIQNLEISKLVKREPTTAITWNSLTENEPPAKRIKHETSENEGKVFEMIQFTKYCLFRFFHHKSRRLRHILTGSSISYVTLSF